MEKKKKKLQLRKETVTILNGNGMSNVIGGNELSYHTGMETCGTNKPDCKNGGVVGVASNIGQNFYYICHCQPGYHGDRCQYEHYLPTEICDL